MNTPIRLLVAVAALLALAGALLATAGSAGAQSATNVPVGDLWFCDSSNENGTCTTEISVGDSVLWDFSDASLPHTTSSVDGSLWDSGTINDGSTVQFTFSEAGTFAYQCNIHPGQMQGQIVVTAAAQEPVDDTPPADSTSDGAAPEIVEAPASGTGPGTTSSSAISAWYVAGLAMAGLLLMSAGLVLVSARRRLN